MTKVVLPTLAAGYASVDQLNAAFDTIEQAFDNTVSRDGDVPNHLTAPLDLNSQQLLNKVYAVEDTHVPAWGQVRTYIEGLAGGAILQSIEYQTSIAAQTVFNLTGPSYTPGSNNLAVFDDGLRKFPVQDYVETDGDTVTFLVAPSTGSKMAFVINEYLGSVDAPSSVPWNSLTGVPAFASRWPTYAEVTNKPTTFAPSAHTHNASDITAGRLADARRGVFVQSAQPSSPTTGDLWVF
jgi:hypothetical protein